MNDRDMMKEAQTPRRERRIEEIIRILSEIERCIELIYDDAAQKGIVAYFTQEGGRP